MTTIEVPLSSQMYQYLDKGNLELAYRVACLGVTEGDWEALGKQALEALDFSTARKAYVRLKDLKHLEFISDLEEKILTCCSTSITALGTTALVVEIVSIR